MKSQVHIHLSIKALSQVYTIKIAFNFQCTDKGAIIFISSTFHACLARQWAPLLFSQLLYETSAYIKQGQQQFYTMSKQGIGKRKERGKRW